MATRPKLGALPLVFFVCLAACRLAAGSFAERMSAGAAEMVTPGKMSVAVEGAGLAITIQPDRAETEIRLPLASPLDSRGKDRLLLTMRSRESSGISLCLSRIHLEGEKGQRATYEPDFGIAPEWNMRTALFSEFTGAVPDTVSAVILHFWVPNETGGEFVAYIKDLELLNAADIVSRVVAPAGPAPARLTPTRSKLTPQDRRWTSIDPGGGGWYRTMGISPHDGTCFLGSDVGGIYTSRDRCKSWQLHVGDLPNRYVQGFAFDPLDPDLVIAGTKGGPVRSTDNGQTWKPARVGLPGCLTFGQSAPVLSVAFHPTRPGLVLAGGGTDSSGYQGEIPRKGKGGTFSQCGRIYRSLDRGQSWGVCQLPGEEAAAYSVTSFVFPPDHPDLVYAAANGGLFRSADAGKTWERHGPDLSRYTLGFLAATKAEPGTWLLSYSKGPGNRGGVLRSRDQGRTWEEANQGLPARIAAWRLIADARAPKTFYVGWFRSAGFYVTLDQGETWQELAPYARRSPKPYLQFAGTSATGLAQDPRNPARLVICDAMHAYQTLDAGQSWALVTTDPVAPATPDRPTVWRGRNCAVLCSGLRQVLAVDPSAPRSIYCGYWDVGAWKTEDGGQTFFRTTNGMDTGYGCMSAVVLDPADSRIVYLVGGNNRHSQRVYKSVDSGAGYYLLGHPGSGLAPGVIGNLVIDPTSPIDKRVIYACVSGKDMKRPGEAGVFPAGVYRSDDGGFTWQPKNTGLPKGYGKFAQLAMDPRSPRRLFLACNSIHPPGYVARSEDGGESWTVVKDKVEPQCVLVDPLDSRKVYVGNRNFSGNAYPNAFYRSLDGGDTWESLDQDAFPCARFAELALDKGRRINVTCLAADPLTPGRLYLACSSHGYDISNVGGVYTSKDWGQSWQVFDMTGLANHSVSALVIDPTDPARLYVGTGGNGFFRYGPPPR